jgi:hypothetical protein
MLLKYNETPNTSVQYRNPNCSKHAGNQKVVFQKAQAATLKKAHCL